VTGWSAAEISAYDQVLAGADAELDWLVRTLQIGTAEVGERQAMADVGAFLARRRDAAGLAGLLAAALRRLSGEQP
jgi:hypothetical protein